MSRRLIQPPSKCGPSEVARYPHHVTAWSCQGTDGRAGMECFDVITAWCHQQWDHGEWVTTLEEDCSMPWSPRWYISIRTRRPEDHMLAQVTWE
jgi:hypothetical protein